MLIRKQIIKEKHPDLYEKYKLAFAFFEGDYIKTSILHDLIGVEQTDEIFNEIVSTILRDNPKSRVYEVVEVKPGNEGNG